MRQCFKKFQNVGFFKRNATLRPVAFRPAAVNVLPGAHTLEFADDPTELAFPYLQSFDLVRTLRPDLSHALLLGAGAYTYPTHFLAAFPEVYLDTVEIDDELDRIATEYFHLEPNDRLRIFEVDARKYLATPKGPYDAIFMDTFSSALSIPPHLTTEEFVRSLERSLAKDGVLLVNIIASVEGPDSGFLHAFTSTIGTVFPHIVLLPIREHLERSRIQNIVLIASKTALPDDPSAYAPWRPLSDVAPADSELVFTDEFAPVERYTAGFIDSLYARGRK